MGGGHVQTADRQHGRPLDRSPGADRGKRSQPLREIGAITRGRVRELSSLFGHEQATFSSVFRPRETPEVRFLAPPGLPSSAPRAYGSL